jgi:hypothetical protein
VSAFDPPLHLSLWDGSESHSFPTLRCCRRDGVALLEAHSWGALKTKKLSRANGRVVKFARDQSGLLGEGFRKFIGRRLRDTNLHPSCAIQGGYNVVVMEIVQVPALSLF